MSGTIEKKKRKKKLEGGTIRWKIMSNLYDKKREKNKIDKSYKWDPVFLKWNNMLKYV